MVKHLLFMAAMLLPAKAVIAQTNDSITITSTQELTDTADTARSSRQTCGRYGLLPHV